MALVRFNDGTPERSVSADEGSGIWQVLNGEVDGAPEQQAFCERVSRVCLNWHNAPDSYIKAHFDIIAPMVMGSWIVDSYKVADGKHASRGQILHPEPGDFNGWAFGKKWGLLKNGKLTELGLMHARQQKVRYWSDFNNKE